MKKELKPAIAFACAVAILAGVQTQAQAQETVKTRIGDLSFTHDFANGYPTDATQKLLFNEIDLQRACQAYIWSIPIVSMAQWQYAHTEQLGAENGQIVFVESYDDKLGGPEAEGYKIHRSPTNSFLVEGRRTFAALLPHRRTPEG